MRILLILSFSFLAIIAQAQSSKYLTLQECIDVAIKNNIQVRQSLTEIERTEINKDQSRLNMLPSVNANASQAFAFGRSLDPFTNQFTNEPIKFSNFGVNAQLTLFNSFQVQNSIRQSKADADMAAFNYEKRKNDIMLNVVGAYLQILLDKEALLNAQNQYSVTSEQLVRTEKLVQAGALAQANLSDIIAQNATDELAVANAENALMLSKLNMVQLLQLPYTEDFDIIVPNLDVLLSEPITQTPDQIYNEALSNQPDIKSAQAGVKSSMIGVQIARSGFGPSLTAAAQFNTNYSSVNYRFIPTGDIIQQQIGYTQIGNEAVVKDAANGFLERNPFFDQLDQAKRTTVSLNLNIPIVNRWQTRTNTSLAKIQKINAELNYEASKNQLRQTIEQSYANAKAAAKRYEVALKQVEAMELSFKNTEQRFNLGVLNSVDYTIARNNLNTATSNLLQAKYQYIFRMKILDFYQNKPIVF